MNKQNTTAKYTQKSKQHKIQQNKTTLFESPPTTLDQETKWALILQLSGAQTEQLQWK